MHEMSLIGDVVDVVERYAKAEGAARVVSVNLVIGEMRDVVDSLLDSCFAHLTRGGAAEGARLHVRKTPLKARCRECNTVFPVALDPHRLPACPDCASRNLAMFSGGEFYIESIEVADDSAQQTNDTKRKEVA